jgi:hypothetical protein
MSIKDRIDQVKKDCDRIKNDISAIREQDQNVHHSTSRTLFSWVLPISRLSHVSAVSLPLHFIFSISLLLVRLVDFVLSLFLSSIPLFFLFIYSFTDL